ncbi:NUDIX hydrolase [Marinobacteraceae bacterium S3BR75-40.1]
MKYCSQCGEPVEHRVPEGDNRPRHVCPSCGQIHYFNPRIVAGTIPCWQGKVLLCKRAIEPRYGYWTLPAGFMENAETTTEAAMRETWEEARARVDVEGLYTMVNVPHIDQVHLFFRASLIDGEYGVGEESLDVQLFEEDNIPWEELAFPTVKETLEHFFADRQQNDFQVRVSDIRRPMRKD